MTMDIKRAEVAKLLLIVPLEPRQESGVIVTAPLHAQEETYCMAGTKL